MKRIRKSLRGQLWKRGIAYVLVWCLVMNTSVPTLLALGPGDMTGNNGLLGDGTNGNAAPVWGADTILETANGAVIDWSNFNTAAGESVTFQQYDALGGSPSSSSAVLNQIASASPTQFLGDLTANGRVFIVNPAGVVFGNNSSTVNVSQLVLSGLNITNFDAVANSGALPQFAGGAGTVTNGAEVTANSLCLVGKKVINNGSLNTSSTGYVVLAAGENVYLTQQGSDILVNISFSGTAQDYYGADTLPDVSNSSLVTSGAIFLAAGDTFSRAIANTGIFTARSGTITANAAKIRNAGWFQTNTSGMDGDGGTISLTATEEIKMDYDFGGFPGHIESNAGPNGNGGNVTLQTEGTVTMLDGTYIAARGGTVSGDGGNVKITCDQFVIDGDIDASPQNATGANGTLTIDPPTVAIVDEADYIPGTANTIPTDSIEALSTGGTNLIVQADHAITVRSLVDGIIGGRGDIELATTQPDGSVTFEDPSDTISTVQGDIRMSAGSGGIVAGNLETGRGAAGSEPGQIVLQTSDGGSISAESLTVREGQGTGAIDVTSAGDLQVTGAVAVGADNPIDDAAGEDAQALVSLESGDDMALNGGVTADAHATSAGNAIAHVTITSGANQTTTGDLTVGADLAATAQADTGTSDALVEVDAWGAINWVGSAQAVADGDSSQVHVEGRVSDLEQNSEGDSAQIIITERTPGLEGIDDTGTTHMSTQLPLDGSVLDNDNNPDQNPLTATLVDGPDHATAFTLNADGTYSYTPEDGFVGDDTFTYQVSDGTRTDTAVVTISVTNDLPVAVDDAANTYMNRATNINVLTNDTDTNGDPLSVVQGTDPAHGTVTLNGNGTFTYTPEPGYTGTDTFTYDMTDGQLDGTNNPVVTTGTVTVNISNAPPIPESGVVAPGLERRDIEYSGCPALAKWVAKELGVKESGLNIWMANALASSRDIQPFETYERLRDAALILKDDSGAHVAALTQVVNEFAASTAPPTEEQMASIAEAIADNAGTDNQYGIADEYLKALAQYIGILNAEMGLSMDEAVQFATANYVRPLSERGNANVAAYVTARLAQLKG